MKVKKKSEPKKVKVSGPGVGKQVQASLPTEFMVDTREAGFGDMVVTILVRFISFTVIDDHRFKI